MDAGTTPHRYVADFSLALINRTGAYYIGRDILEQLPEHFAAIRYWRTFSKAEPRGLVRRLLGRAMLFELGHFPITEHLPRSGAAPTLFLDPLYVLRADLSARDIVLCHDIGPVSHPDLFDRKTGELYADAYRRICQAKPGMVFVSEASRREFVAAFGADFRFLQVIPLYVRAETDIGPDRAPAGIHPPFLLTVGALEKRKNHVRVIEAFGRSGLRERGYSYVFCGPRGNAAQEVQSAAAAAPGVHALGYLDDAEVRWLYRNAAGFVLPSLLEGFGLPALEAARHGLVSLVSAGGAQQEAVGEGAILVDPISVTSIAEGLRLLVDMAPEERARRLALARRHAAELSFDRYLARWSALLAG